MKTLLSVLSLGVFSVVASNAQILLSGGLTYSQNFDSLANTPAAGSGTWTDNATPGVEGWYASRAFSANTSGGFGPFAYSTYRIGDGSANNGTIWSFGAADATDRALGSLGSGTVRSNVFGLRLANNTTDTLGNILISYTAEQWRNGGNTAAQTLGFSYKISSTPFSSPLDMSGAGANGWVGFSGLDALTPITGATATALDGNLAANQVVFSGVLLSGVTLSPGEEIFLRWLDLDDAGNDHGFGIDNFSVSFSSVVPEPAVATLSGLVALGLLFWRRNRR